jgi:hypothetical protein
MANEIALTASQVRMVDPSKCETVNAIALSAVTQGEALYIDPTTGKVAPADANGAGLQQFRGIALNAAAAGFPVTVLKRGAVYGYTLTSMNYDAIAYLSDTVGDLSTAVGTMTVNCGRVIALTDGSTMTKVLYIDADYLRAWA